MTPTVTASSRTPTTTTTTTARWTSTGPTRTATATSPRSPWTTTRTAPSTASARTATRTARTTRPRRTPTSTARTTPTATATRKPPPSPPSNPSARDLESPGVDPTPGLSRSRRSLTLADCVGVVQGGLAEGAFGVEAGFDRGRDQADQRGAEGRLVPGRVGGLVRDRGDHSGPGRAREQFRRERERGLRQRDAVHRGLAGLLRPLDLLPVGLDVRGAFDGDVAEDVRVPAYQLVDEIAGDLVDRPALGLGQLLGESGVERHLQQHVAQFLAQRRQIPPH